MLDEPPNPALNGDDALALQLPIWLFSQRFMKILLKHLRERWWYAWLVAGSLKTVSVLALPK